MSSQKSVRNKAQRLKHKCDCLATQIAAFSAGEKVASLLVLALAGLLAKKTLKKVALVDLKTLKLSGTILAMAADKIRHSTGLESIRAEEFER